jgi:site-specific DNA recombinase
MTKRAVAYVRVSTGRQAEEGLSLGEQKRRAEAHIAAKGWTHAGTFTEAGVSGRKDDRPELRRLLDLVDQRAVDVVVIPKLDRFGRSVRQLAENFERLDRASVELVSLAESIDTHTATGKLLRNVLAALAEFESDVIGERVASVTAARAEQGKAHGRAPFGYRQSTGGLVVHPPEAAVIERIFRAYAVEGRSQRTICRDVNSEGISAQRGQWTQGAVSKVLGNPVYAGRVRLNGETYDGCHEPIISAELWRKAEQLREATTRTRRGKAPTANHVLAGGLLRCGRCGSAMGATTKARGYETYTCSGRAKHGLHYCSQPPARRQPVDEAIWQFFTTAALDLDATRAAIVEQHTAKLGELGALQAQAEQEAQRAQDRLTRVRRDYQDGVLDAADWCSMRDELAGEHEAAVAQVKRLADQRQAVEREAEQLDAESVLLDELTALRALVVGEVRDGSRASLDAFRVALRRLFTDFELVPAFGWGADGRDDAVIWQGDPLDAPAGYDLRPHVRADAIDWNDEGPTFPALKRAALALGRSDAVGLQR